MAPVTIHPAFMKAAQYFDIKIVTVPLTNNYQPDLSKYELVSCLKGVHKFNNGWLSAYGYPDNKSTSTSTLQHPMLVCMYMF